MLFSLCRRRAHVESIDNFDGLRSEILKKKHRYLVIKLIPEMVLRMQRSKSLLPFQQHTLIAHLSILSSTNLFFFIS